MNEEYLITTDDQLESIIGLPHEGLIEKVFSALDEEMRAFIRRSPLVFLSTVDDSGRIDSSPKGDAPGFVQIDECGNLLIPDRPGNKLIFGFKNILRNNQIGLIFMVPSMRETLRVKGRARLSHDPQLLQQLAAQGKPALLCTHVEVEECFFHCGKAMIRSNIWKPERWAEQNESLMLKSAVRKNNADEQGAKDLEELIEGSYRNNLY